MKKIAVICFLCLSVTIYAQRAFPGAEGYGAITRGAYSGSDTPKILIVDTLDSGDFGDEASGRGTFRWCINRTYPRIVLFEVSGIIDYRDLTEFITIEKPYLSVYGQTAPGMGITLYGTMLRISNPSKNVDIDVHDIIIQHIHIRHGDNPGGIGYNDRDVLGIFCDNVMIDHCSFSWSIDEILDIGREAKNITLSNNIFSEPLHYSYHFKESGNHRPEKHGFTALIGTSENISFVKNLIAFSTGRNPASSSASIAIINNMMYNSDGCKLGANIYGSGDVQKVWYQGNVVLKTENTDCSNSVYAAQINSDVNDNSKLYFHDNICTLSLQNPDISEWGKIHSNNDDIVPVTVSPLPNKYYQIIESSEVENHILKYAGAKPDSRDSVDSRIINQVKNRVGEYINSPFPLPVRAYNSDITDTETDDGDFTNGFDWSSEPKSIIINSSTIFLNQNFGSMTDILNAINSQLTNEIEAYNIHGGNYIGFRTKPKGADQTITVSEDGLTDFGILPGTYYGSDGFEGIPEITKIYRPILSMNNYPETNPHKDDNGDGYTNLEDWIFNLYKGGYSLIDSCHNKDCCLVFPNPLFNEINLHFNPESNLNFPLKAKVYTIDGKLLTVKKNINSFEENVSVHKIRSAKWLIIEIEDAGDKVIYSGKVLVAKNLN